MALITQAIPALFNGVSQQPATLRLPSQAEKQINGYSTVVDGLRKRPAFEHVAKISSGTMAGAAHFHTINRDANERYNVIITDGNIQVFDLAGNEKTVYDPVSAKASYLDIPAGANAQKSFAVVTIADYSFVVNKTKVVANKVPPEPEPPEFQYYYNPWGPFPSYSSGYGGYSGSYKGSKQTFSDLPHPDDDNPPQNGDIWKVAGYDEDNFGSYYVKREGGVWEETYKPGEDSGLDETTMPHALVRNSDGTFSFVPFTWKVRQFGDAETNPDPSFTGKKIQDIFYYKNRLGVVAGENVVFSEAGGYDNYYRNTLTTLLDSDVVDAAVSSAKVSNLEHAVPFQNNLMLFADQTQFSLNVDELLTPTSVSIDAVTGYDVQPGVRPVSIGSDVYFVTPSGSYSRIREYFVRANNSNETDAADITAHVPRYLPKSITMMTGNSNEDVLFGISDEPGHENRIYVYKFYWNEDGKAQSSWSYWEIDDADNAKVIAISSLENEVYILVQRDDGVYLERADLQSGYATNNLDEAVLLDRLIGLTGTYLSGSDQTEFNLPFPVTNQSDYQLVRGAGFTGNVMSKVTPGNITWVDNTTIRIPGNETAGTMYGGMKYTMKYTFSEQFVKNGDKSVTTGRLMMRTFVIYFTRTAFFKTEVSPYGNNPLVEAVVPAQLSEFTGKTLGESSLELGEPNYHTGRYAFQIHGDSKIAEVALVNDTHVQSRFQSAEWEGFYHNRARTL